MQGCVRTLVIQTLAQSGHLHTLFPHSLTPWHRQYHVVLIGRSRSSIAENNMAPHYGDEQSGIWCVLCEVSLWMNLWWPFFPNMLLCHIIFHMLCHYYLIISRGKQLRKTIQVYRLCHFTLYLKARDQQHQQLPSNPTQDSHLQNSFFPKTVFDWNKMPDDVVFAETLKGFTTALHSGD